MALLDDIMKDIPDEPETKKEAEQNDEPDQTGAGKSMFGYSDQFKGEFGDRKKQY